MEHTKEPWHVDPKAALRVASGDSTVCSCGTADSIRDQWEPNARRIVACVNACEGIPTEDLERWGTSLITKIQEDNIARLTEQREQWKERCAWESKASFERWEHLSEQRDELAAVLELIFASVLPYREDGSMTIPDHVADRAVAALAKVKKEGPSGG